MISHRAFMVLTNSYSEGKFICIIYCYVRFIIYRFTFFFFFTNDRAFTSNSLSRVHLLPRVKLWNEVSLILFWNIFTQHYPIREKASIIFVHQARTKVMEWKKKIGSLSAGMRIMKKVTWEFSRNIACNIICIGE